MSHTFAVVIDNNDSYAWGGMPDIQVSAQLFGGSPLDPNLNLYTPVFTRGEIMVLVGGREPNGAGRKPSKWDVEIEEFDNFDDALARSIELSREA